MHTYYISRDLRMEFRLFQNELYVLYVKTHIRHWGWEKYSGDAI